MSGAKPLNLAYSIFRAVLNVGILSFSLTLMIAESRAEEKDTMVKVIVNLINKKN